MKKIIGIILCICICSMVLAGCGINSDNTTQIESVEYTDKLSLQAQEIINNYQGDGSDDEYLYALSVLTANYIRKNALAEKEYYEKQISNLDVSIMFLEKANKTEEVKALKEQREKLVELRKQAENTIERANENLKMNINREL